MSEWLGDLGAKWRQDRDRARGRRTQGATVSRHIKDLFQGTGLNLDPGDTGSLLLSTGIVPDPAPAVALDPGRAQQLLDRRGDRQSEHPPDF